ncbi:hypothetical protein [Bacillus cereus]|uniref:hypothetical protein n=1 Tax=Bacillus cereus group TaxID=86661 RepID=UPI001C54FD50|nr:hypothetical protein [Bacillus cereus]
MNREDEKFELAEKQKTEPAKIVEFTKKETKAPLTGKSGSRLMEKLKKRRDEEFGKDK